jgi:hypothetical protein
MPLRPAAEPAVAPPPAGPPAGRRVRVGALPEGVVVDPGVSLVAVAVRDPAQLVLIDARSGRVVLRLLRGTSSSRARTDLC